MGLLKLCDRVGVVHAFESCIDEFFQPIDARRIDSFGKKLHVVRTLLQHGTEQIFEKGFG